MNIYDNAQSLTITHNIVTSYYCFTTKCLYTKCTPGDNKKSKGSLRHKVIVVTVQRS